MNQNQEFIETEIGNIPSDWKIEKLKNLCTKIGSGATPRGGSNVYVSSGITLIRSQNVYDDGFNEQGLAFINESAAEKLQNVEVKEHDVLLNITGDSICRASIVPKEILPARVNQHVSILRTNEKLYYRFLFYFLSLNKTKNKLLSYDAGGTRQALTKSMLEEFHVPLPEYEEQVKIGDFFWTITEKIALNRSMNSTLEAIGQALFKNWFVDFEFPDEEGKPYRSSGREMVETELGEVPRGCRVVKNISELCSLINYGYTQSSTEEKIGPKFLRVMDINKGDWIDWTSVPYCEIEDKNLPKYLLEKGDIVVARMADPGKLAIFESDIAAVFASYLIRIRLNNTNYSYYLYYLMKSKYYQEYILGAATGSVQKNLNAKGLTNGLPIIIPTNEIIIRFNKIIGSLRKKINENVTESINLSQIRDALLPKLMSGEIRVNVEREVKNETMG